MSPWRWRLIRWLGGDFLLDAYSEMSTQLTSARLRSAALTARIAFSGDEPAASELRERGYIEGQAALARGLLRDLVRFLPERIDDTPYPPPRVRLEIERDETRAVLRDLCGRFGDNEWPDDLYVPDVLRKHLEEHLNDRELQHRDDLAREEGDG